LRKCSVKAYLNPLPARTLVSYKIPVCEGLLKLNDVLIVAPTGNELEVPRSSVTYELSSGAMTTVCPLAFVSTTSSCPLPDLKMSRTTVIGLFMAEVPTFLTATACTKFFVPLLYLNPLFVI
jgi:hypothetical protein